MKRETGYYHVRFKDADYWEIGYWDLSDKWLMAGFSEDFNDSHFAEIDERKIERPKQKEIEK